MHDLISLPCATGPCVVCGEESQGSPYWIGMSQEAWDIIRPLWSDAGKFPVSPWSGVLEQKTTFFVGLDRPLCSPECSLKYKESEHG